MPLKHAWAPLLIGLLLLPAGATPATAASSPGISANGPFLHDASGRALILRGVNAVYKVPPYAIPSFPAADAALMQALGFDIVRVGVIWKGLEPGTAGVNDPAICAPGMPSRAGPRQWDKQVADAYLARVDQVVATLGGYGIRSLIDMHQDVWNELFAGEGAPDWAVCTDGLPATNTNAWNDNYAEPAVGVAFDHFWNNDVAGDLQGEYERAFAYTAAHFRANPNVIGYDLFNEPFSSEIYSLGGAAAFDARLECFYTGRAHPGTLQGGAPDTCAPTLPAEGLIPRLEAADPNHLVFYEPDVSSDFGNPDWIGAMPFPRLVLNFHDYCFTQQQGPNCPLEETQAFANKARERAAAASAQQPQGPGWFLSEFGAEDDATDLTRMTQLADQNLVGWTYWQWRQYSDPTGAWNEALVNPDGSLKPKASILSRAYAQAVAGTPTAMSFDPTSGDFQLAFTPDPGIAAPTAVFMPLRLHYPNGYCATAAGARITSPPNAQLLTLVALPGATQVTVAARACSS